MDFKKELSKNVRIGRLEKKIREGGGIKFLYDLAGEVGKVATTVVESNLAEAFPNGHVEENDVRTVVSPVFKECAAYVAEMSAAAINEMYRKSGVGLKAVLPERNADRENEIIREISRRSFNDGSD